MQARKSIKILLMRHAESKFNAAKDAWKEKNGEEENEAFKLEIRYAKNPEFYDACLTETGIEEARSAQPKLAKYKNIKRVFVSPFLRTAQTATEAMSKYDGAPEWRFLPLLKETLETSCDFAIRTEKVLLEFPFIEDETEKDLTDKLWFMKVISEQKDGPNNHLKAVEIFEKENGGPEAVLDFMKELDPRQLEDDFQIKDRVMRAKKYIGEYAKKAIEAGEITEDYQILIVSHGNFLEPFTAKSFNEDAQPQDTNEFKNAEVYEYDLEL